MLPDLKTEIPGPESKRLAGELRRYESHNLTYISDDFPVFWERAEGANVWDVDGNRFLDLNGGFGVATAGFGPDYLVETFRSQAATLYHGMGDVHPSRVKVQLCRALSEITYERWENQSGKVILGSAGFEAVEASLKTARIATGKPGVLAFESGYHGLGYGAMAATGMKAFSTPFEDQVKPFVRHIPFPDAGPNGVIPSGHEWQGKEAFRKRLQEAWNPQMGAILVEPIQGRGGERFPAPWLLPLLREFADQNEALLIFDEIYTGFFRTGKWFACEHWKTTPDIICLGKAMSGSYPISACVGRASVMDAWPESCGEAIHTRTFLGSPMGCALALASIAYWKETDESFGLKDPGSFWMQKLKPLSEIPGVAAVRGAGLLWAVEFKEAGRASALVERALKKGLILLPAGEDGRVLSIKPSIVHTEEHATFTAEVLTELIR